MSASDTVRGHDGVIRPRRQCPRCRSSVQIYETAVGLACPTCGHAWRQIRRRPTINRFREYLQ